MTARVPRGKVYQQPNRAIVFRQHLVIKQKQLITRICAAEMAVRYAALSACRKVHLCHCNSLGGAT